MRRLLKFLHTLGAAGLTGGMAALAIIVIVTPSTIGPAAYVPIVVAMAKIAGWILGPSIVLTVISGLFAMVATPVFQDVGWVWAKAATGILILTGGLHVLAPIQEEAKRNASALAAAPDPATVARLLASENGTLWVLIAVAIANIALGVWRPRFGKSRA